MSSTETGTNNAEELISMPLSVAVPVLALRGAGAGPGAGSGAGFGLGLDIESDSEESISIGNVGQLHHQQVRNQALMEAAKRAAQFEENSIRLASGLRDGSNVAQLSWPRAVSDISLSDNSIHFHRQVYGADEDADQPSQMKLEDLVEFMKQGMKEQDLLEEARKMQAASASSGAVASLNTKTVLPTVMKALAEKKARMDEAQRHGAANANANDDLKDTRVSINANAATITGVVGSGELSMGGLRLHRSPQQSLTKSNPTMQSPQQQRNSKKVWSAETDADLEMKVSAGLELGAGKTEKENTQFQPAAVSASPAHHDRDGAGAGAGAGAGPHSQTGAEVELELTDIPDGLRGFRARDGLSGAQVEERRLTYGFNEIVEKKRNPMIKFLLYFTGSIAYLIEAAMILSAVLSDWPDFGIILALLIINALIGFIEEAKAESAVAALLSTLALQTKCVRNKQFMDVPARELVPGDIISIRLGDIIPADAKLLGLNANFESTNADLLIDQSGLTGESLAVAKHLNDLVYSGTICKQGQMLALVVATGSNTFLGRAAHLISITNESGHFQKVIAHIGNFLIASTLTMVAIVLIVGCTAEGQDFVDQLKFALVLTIASIPVGLPTVMSVTMAVGAKQLAAKRVIVKRLTAVEEMAGVDILCSDKTGTLTLNQLTLDAPYLCGSFSEADLLFYAFLSSESATNDAIESCIRSTALAKVPMLANAATVTGQQQQLGGISELGDRLYNAIGYKILQFQPFDPTSKMTRATVLDMKNNKVFCVAKGAPQVILKLSDRESPAAIQAAEVAIVNFARSGLRALGVARSADITVAEHEQGGHSQTDRLSWHLIGLLSLLDPPRPDSASTIAACKDYGISVKMVTGDAILIAKEVSRRLGMHRTILSPDKLTDTSISEAEITHHVEKADGFAQVVPEDKFRVVELLQKRNHLVAMTGDGVNDAPALKKADVGIAVHGCTDAARSAADIVLLEPGLSAIVDGIMTSRQIFQRMRSYAVYRITSTINFLSFLFCTIIIWKWALSPTLVVIIALLNDAATLSISVDNALVSKKPDKWRIGQLITLSIILGIMLTGSSFAHFLISKYYFNNSDDFTETVLYLQLSSCGGLVIFSTRLTEPFYRSRPSIIFCTAVLAIQLFSLFISVYGGLSTAIGWPWGITVLCISFGYFCLLDMVKCGVYRYWSFQLTARLWPSKQRRDKLKAKLEHAARLERVEQTVLKIRRAMTLVECAMKFKHYKPLPEPLIALPKAPHH